VTVGLSARGLTQRYHGREVLSGLDLELQPGEVLGLLGPNGAGKSTAFGIIAGLVRPLTGSVSMDGACMDALPLWRRVRAGLGYLAQEPTVIRGLSVGDNIRLVPGQVDLPSLLERTGLTDLVDSSAGTLSGGERRRLEIARCLATGPRYLLMDEPFSGVDPVGVEALQRTIRVLVEDGLGVLLTDHAVRAALGVCHRAIILDAGCVMARGAPSDVVENSHVRARYLGEEFTLPSHIQEG